MVKTIGVSQFACQQFTEAGILGELITTPLSENSIGGASARYQHAATKISLFARLRMRNCG
jgi:hypothetical protein